MVTKWTDSLTSQHGGVPRSRWRRRLKLPVTWEPVSGFEPLACRLQEARPHAACALAAPMAHVNALTTLAALGLSGASFHEPFHADDGHWFHDASQE
jgi:hypothetical protein